MGGEDILIGCKAVGLSLKTAACVCLVTGTKKTAKYEDVRK